MKEKIKKIGLIMFYLSIWPIFLLSLLMIYTIVSLKRSSFFEFFGTVDKQNVSLIFLLAFLSGYLLRNHFRYLFSKIIVLIFGKRNI